MTHGYDVIGDVHGSIVKLEGLLATLGYRRSAADGPWHHPDRTAVFVGDLIDRGVGQRRVIQLVRSMVDAGAAQIVLGNHEFNAIGYATEDHRDDPPRGHLRERNEKHAKQHQQFVDEVGLDSPTHAELVGWFATFPMWLELPGLRVVHACWSDQHIEHLRAAHGGSGVPSGRDARAELYTKETRGYDAIEVVLKGPEVALPEHLWYLDKDGNLRRKARYRWWGGGANTLRDRGVLPAGSRRPDGSPHPGFDDTPVPDDVATPYTDPTPVIIGHYWLDGRVGPLSDRVACVDYSAVAGGQLVAYRFDGEPTLSADKMVAFPPG